MSRALRGVAGILALVLPLLLAARATATHSVDHRYVVLGYVHDERGRPVERAAVSAQREKTGLSYRTTTDTDGFYVLVVHLHDEDVLEWLQVQTGAVRLRVGARFDPLDRERLRGTPPGGLPRRPGAGAP